MQNPFVSQAPIDPIECQFSLYVDRFEQYCIVSSITEEAKKIALFITVLGNNHHQLLTNLMYPDKPSLVQQKS